MRKASPETTIVVNPLPSPVEIGIYGSDGLLVEQRKIDGYVSEILVEAMLSVLEEYEVGEIVYVNGPGSRMGVKLAYVALKTVELLENIPLRACSAFELNGGSPIKAMGSLYFVKEKETIITKKLEGEVEERFDMPESVDEISIEESNLPDYRIPAV